MYDKLLDCYVPVTRSRHPFRPPPSARIVDQVIHLASGVRGAKEDLTT